MDQKILKGMLAGFVATAGLSIIMALKSVVGIMPQLDVIGILSGMLGSSRAMGWFVHFVIGTVLYGTAIASLSVPGIKSFTLSGLVLGVGGWLVMMIVLMPLAGHGSFGTDLGIITPLMTLMLHLVFGAILGWTYGRMTSITVKQSSI